MRYTSSMNEFLTVEETAKSLGVSARFVRGEMACGKLAYMHVSPRIKLIRVSALETYKAIPVQPRGRRQRRKALETDTA